MGILHRVYASRAPEVWEAETRLLHAMRLVRRPVAVQWLVTAACDLKCPHCYSGAGKRVAGELTTEEARRLIIDELVALGRPTFVLAGGELLLRKDIPELVEYACERGLPWAMHTHGLHVPRFRELFRRRPPSLAAISLDGDRDEHDAFRGRPGSFDGAIEAMRLLKEEGCGEVVAGTTVTRRNADRIPELFPVVRASAADSWGLHLFAPEGRGAEHLELMPTAEQLRRVAAFAREARREFHVELCNEWGSAGEDDHLYRDQPFLCGAGRVSFVISAGGEVLPCTTTDLSESEGNVRATPLRRLWSRGFTRFRSAGHGACSEGGECWLQSRNGVRCGQDAFGAVARSSVAPVLLDRLPALAPGREVGLVSERTARLVRAAALAAVMLEATVGRRRAPVEDDGAGATVAQGARDFPALTAAQLDQHARATRPGSAWRSLLHELQEGAPGGWEKAQELAQQVGPRSRLAATLEIHVAHRASLQGETPAQLAGLLDAVESHAIFDAPLVDYLWRRVRDLPLDPSPAEAASHARLHARLDRHLRIAAALDAARLVIRPASFGAWRSKAAPPSNAKPRLKIEEQLAELKKAYASASSRDFTRPGSFSLKLVSGAATYLPPGGARRLSVGDRITLERLDLLRSSGDCIFEHEELGAMPLPAGHQATFHSLQRRLSPAALEKLDALIRSAAQGDKEALARLSPLAGLATLRIARFLAANPASPGVDGLRTLLREGGG